ncbi:MAG: response regulator [Candidatus Ozemobacteraceae bacterium]
MKSFFRERSIGAKLTLIIVTVSFVALASYFAISTTIDRRQSHLVLVGQTRMLARIAAEYSVSNLVFQYQPETAADLDKLFLLPDIEEAQMYDAEGRLFTSRIKPGLHPLPCPETISPLQEDEVKFPDDRLEVFQQMTFRGKRHGTLRLVASTTSFQTILDTRVAILGVFSAIILLLVYFMATAVQRWVSQPIIELIAKFKEIANGNLSIRVEVPGAEGEIASLCQNVNLMADALENRVREIERSAERYEALISASNTGAWEYHEDSGFLWCSPEYFSMLGRDIHEYDMSGARNLEQTWTNLLHPDDRLQALQNFSESLTQTNMYQQNFRMKHRDGHWVWIWSRGKALRDPQGRPTSIVVGTHIDITERITLEERLRQSEKMDSIGQLAGGIAHDFNNQLTGILGSAELILTKLSDPILRTWVENIQKSALRSAELTKRLLAFARKGKIVTTQVNIHNLIEEVLTLLQHSIDRRITITRHLEAEPPLTVGDPNQLQGALLNLAINARDAMPDGGELSFVTSNAILGEKTPTLDLPPGAYLQISVADTGSGMSKEVQSHLFEPFFTTKEVGKGTGLGLAAVFGAIKSHDGAIRCNSEPGKGTTFRILLPMVTESLPKRAVELSVSPTPGHEQILLVDDEEVARNVTREILQALGYKVTTCRDGVDAIALFSSSWQQIDLVLLDMIMPRMGGPEAYQAMRAINPGVKVILASGFSLNDAANQLLQQGARGFIQKPFQLSELSRKIRQVLSG